MQTKISIANEKYFLYKILIKISPLIIILYSSFYSNHTILSKQMILIISKINKKILFLFKKLSRITKINSTFNVLQIYLH